MKKLTQAERNKRDAERYRFLRDDGHLDYLDPASNKRAPPALIDKVVDRWIRMRGASQVTTKQE